MLPRKAIATPQPAELSDTAAIINAITKASRDPSVDIPKMQFLLDTRRALIAEEAEAEWRDAMASAQSEMLPINKDLANPQTRSRYASLAALDGAIRPIYSAHGFAVTFDTEPHDEPNSLLVVAYVMRRHYSRRYQIPMPADGKGPRGNDVMSKTHATGSAVSYGRRYLLCMAFNLITADDDGNRASGYASALQRHPNAPSWPPEAPNPRARRDPSDLEPKARAQHQAAAENSLLETQLEESVQQTITNAQVEELRRLITQAGVTATGEQVLRQHFELETLEDMTSAQFMIACNKLKDRIGDKSNGSEQE